MVPFVSRLERCGLVDRTKVDGRSQALALTAAGRALLAKARRVVGSFEASLMKRVPEKMRPMVLPILMALWKGPDSSS
jgi:DNA-binding MarR family transcriptional regulator